VRSRVIMNHANEAQTRNQENLIRTPEPIVINDSMDTKSNQDLLGHPCKGRLYH
jgi:hypothetical protein